MGLLKTDVRGGIAIVTLHDPARRNALSLAMADELAATLDTLSTSPEVGALVITGTPPAFSAGADLADLERADRTRLRQIYEGFLVVARFPLLTIAAVNGPAVGAGFNLALACDVRVASRSARFESRFLDLALHPGGGHIWTLRELVGPQVVSALVLCGEGLDGEEAARRGLAWSCVDDDVVLDEAARLAAQAVAAPREMVRRLKATIRSMAGVADHAKAVDCELEEQLWSVGRPEFRDRLEALKRRIVERRRP